MATPIILKNENDYLRWEKHSCHKYRLINKTSPFGGYTLEVSVYRVDDQEEYPILTGLRLKPLEVYDLDIKFRESTNFGGDGVYRLCAVPILEAPFNTQVFPSVTFRLSIFTLPIVASTDGFVEMFDTTGSIIYNSLNGAANFSSPPTSYSNFTYALGAWGIGNVVEVIPPNGVTLTGLNVPVINNYQIVVISPIVGPHASSLTLSVGGVPIVINPVNECIWAIPAEQLGATHVTAFNVDGGNILGRAYNLATEDGLFVTDLLAALNTNGNVATIEGSANPFIRTRPCRNINSITYGQTQELPKETICDNFYELCDTLACFQNLLRASLCRNKCCQGCMNNTKEEELLNTLADLLHSGLLPLIQADRLSYMGDFGYTEQRIQRTMTIAEYFRKLRTMLFKCGYGCEPKKPCGC